MSDFIVTSSGQRIRKNTKEHRDYALASNKAFLKLSSSPEGKHKISGRSRDQLADHLYETVVMDKVIPPETIQPEDCEPGHDSDTLFYRLYYQPEAHAYLGAFEATPVRYQEVFIPRLFLSFLMLQSPTYVLNEYNLTAYPFSVGEQLQEKLGMVMQEAKDFVMLQKLEETIQASRAEWDNVLRGQEAQNNINTSGYAGNGAANTTRFLGQLQRGDISTFKEYYSESRSALHQILIPEKNFLEVERWDIADLGDTVMGQVTEHGWKFDTILGVKMVRTIKTDSRGDIFKTGNLYGFATPDEIGRNFSLKGLRFWFDKDHQFMSMDASYAFGFLWAIAARVCKMELYNGGVSTTGALRALSGGVSASDELWQDLETLQHDYYNIDEQYSRPSVHFT